jgi:hypothetical protein
MVKFFKNLLEKLKLCLSTTYVLAQYYLLYIILMCKGIEKAQLEEMTKASLKNNTSYAKLIKTQKNDLQDLLSDKKFFSKDRSF